MNRRLQPGSYLFRIVDPQLLKNINFYEENRSDLDVCVPFRIHISFSTNIDNDPDHHAIIYTVPEKKAQIDIDDDIQIALTFGDEIIKDNKYNNIDLNKNFNIIAE